MIGLATALLMSASVSSTCAPVTLALSGKEMLASYRGKPLREASVNFNKAFVTACAEGLLKKKLAQSGRLFLVNAPDANVASIYTREGRQLLEYPFVTRDRHVHVPSTPELHEAIYCAVHGASAAEQEESGRCLPD